MCSEPGRKPLTRESRIDYKLSKWRQRSFKHLTTERLAELVADLKEETQATEENRLEAQYERTKQKQKNKM